MNLVHATLALATPFPASSGNPASPVPAHDPFNWKTYFPVYSLNSYTQKYKWSQKSLPSKASLLSHYTFFCLLPMGFCTAGADSQTNHRIASHNHLGWKSFLRSLRPTANLTLPSPPLNHVPKRHIYTSFQHSGQPVSMLDNPFD